MTAFVIFLLIAIPAGYIAISAEQSRDSGQNKEQEAASTGLYNDWPSRVQMRTYNVPVPGQISSVYYYETNSWKTSSLFVQFRTNDLGLRLFLQNYGLERKDLKSGRVTISQEQAAKVGWDFGGHRQWGGVVHEQPSPEPSQAITVNLDEAGYPIVYVVSTVRF
ncbi:hypothetical protein KGS77_06430 [Streptomyces sp. MST-110588]|nr:hypothetical protein KGS77_06430 [Streptomyces sp. MST-110588]